MAIVKAIDVSTSLLNTSVETSAAMGATAMIIALPKTKKFTAAEVADFVNTIDTMSHAAASARCFPLFGNNAPIRTINVNDEDDVDETFDDGFKIFVRSGFANREFITTAGGLDYAKKMRSFLNSDYAFIEVDKNGQFVIKQNADGTFSGFAAYMGGATPTAGSFKTVYKNRFRLSYDPTTYVNNGVIYKGAEGLLDLTGLQNVTISSAAAASTSVIKVNVKTSFAGTDLIALLGSDLADPDNFIVTKVSDGSLVTPSGVTIVSGAINIAGTYTSASVYTVQLAASSDLFVAGIEGYEQDANGIATISIP